MPNMFDSYRDPIFIDWYTDVNGNKVSIARENEQHKVVNNHIVVAEVMDEFQGVSITGMYEIDWDKEITDVNSFACNYTLGLIRFHSSKEGQSILINSYYSRGVAMYPASRIYTEVENNQIKETLQSIISNGQTAIGNLEQVQTAITNAENATTAAQNQTTIMEQLETDLTTLENTMNTNESSRQTAESNRVLAENERETNESQRILDEADRESAESTRQSNEAIRQQQETDRQTNTATAIANANSATTNVNQAITNAQKIADQTKFIELYNSATTYMKNNIVRYNGSSYMSLQDNNIGNTPNPTGDNSFWGMLSMRGLDGEGSVSMVNNLSPDVNGNITITATDLGAEKTVNKGVANGYAGLDNNGKVPLSQLPDSSKQQTYVVLDSTERNALINLIEGDKAYETSTGDSYIWDSTQWLLQADADWQNVNLDWVNIINKPTSTVTDIDDTVSKKHTHTNKTSLDRLGIDASNNLTIDDIPYESGASIDDTTPSTTTVWSSQKTSDEISDLSGDINKKVGDFNDKIIYVNGTLGNNNNDGLTSLSAKKTIQSAIDSLPLISGGQWTISVASGTYAESVKISSFISSNKSRITIIGTESILGTGTITSATDNHFISDSSKSWTIDQFKGKFCRITSGAYNGNVYPIMGNTSTQLDLTYLGLNIPTGLTFEIFESLTIVDGGNTRPHCVEIYGNVYVTLESLKIINSKDIGIRSEEDVILKCDKCYLEGHIRHAYSAYVNHVTYSSCYFKDTNIAEYGIYGTYIPQHIIRCGFDGFNKVNAVAVQYYIAESGIELSSLYNCYRGIYCYGSRYVKQSFVYIYNSLFSLETSFGTSIYPNNCVIDANSRAGAEGIRASLGSNVYSSMNTFINTTMPHRLQTGSTFYALSSKSDISETRIEAHYESGWISCTTSTQATFTHNFGFVPKSVEVIWSDTNLTNPVTIGKDNTTWTATKTDVIITPAQTKFYKVRAFMR